MVSGPPTIPELNTPQSPIERPDWTSPLARGQGLLHPLRGSSRLLMVRDQDTCARVIASSSKPFTPRFSAIEVIPSSIYGAAGLCVPATVTGLVEQKAIERAAACSTIDQSDFEQEFHLAPRCDAGLIEGLSPSLSVQGMKGQIANSTDFSAALLLDIRMGNERFRKASVIRDPAAKVRRKSYWIDFLRSFDPRRSSFQSWPPDRLVLRTSAYGALVYLAAWTVRVSALSLGLPRKLGIFMGRTRICYERHACKSLIGRIINRQTHSGYFLGPVLCAFA